VTDDAERSVAQTKVLKYAAPRARVFWPPPYVAAVTCGALPLLVGTGVFIAWLVRRSDSLMITGLFVIVGGCIVFLVGCGFLLAYVHYHRRRGRRLEPAVRRKALTAGLLLISNFPAAFGYAALADHLWRTHTVRVVNGSASRIDRFVLRAPGIHVNLGPIEPGQRAEVSFKVQHEGELAYEMVQNGQPSAGVLVGYIEDGRAQEHTLTVGSGATVHSQSPTRLRFR
jgi:hypothetical protein